MGFHKRWINRTGLLTQYSNGGLECVKKYLCADALILEDDFSNQILSLLNEKNDLKASSLLDIELSK